LKIKKILEKLVEGKITLEEAWILIDPDNSPIISRKYSKRKTNQNNGDLLIVRMF